MMNVDHKLRDLKKDYETDIPTSFTDKDKQNIFKTISQETYPKRPKFSQYFQKPAAFVSYAAVIVLIGILSLGQIGLEDTASPKATDNHSTHVAGSSFKDSNQVNVGGGSGETDQVPSSNVVESKINFASLNDSLNEDDQVGSMTVSEIHEESSQVTFSGELVLSGIINKNQDHYQLHVTDYSKVKLPFTEDHEGKLLVDFENIDETENLLQKAYEEEAYIKFIISEYHYRSMDEEIQRSITVNTIILDGNYKEVSSQ